MNTCKTCKWWRPDEREVDMVSPGLHGSCTCPKFGGHGLNAEETSDCAYITDSLGEWELFVGPDFGCIHHHPK